MMLDSEIPKTQTAIIQGEPGVLTIVTDRQVATLSPHQMLVKTIAVALNPCDCKMPVRFPTAGLCDGCDFAGIVVALGDQAAKTGRFRLRDRVFGAVQGSNQADPESGAYCEYIRAEPDFTFHAPEGMSFSTAASFSGTGISTLGVALYWSLQLQGTLDEPTKKPEYVLVYGGSSTTGLMAIQMVKLSGYKVITTCSPRNFDLVKSYGADFIFDYNSPTCAEDIKAASKNTLRYALDPFSEARTVQMCQEAIGRTGGRYCALEQYNVGLCTRKTIKHELVMGGAISGKGVKLPEPYGLPPRPEIGEWAVTWYRCLEKLIIAGKIKPPPLELVSGRFDGIMSGLDRIRKGDVSGKKLVVCLRDEE